MQKSKESVERKLEKNKNHPHYEATEMVENFRKSSFSKESAVLPGLGSKKDYEEDV